MVLLASLKETANRTGTEDGYAFLSAQLPEMSRSIENALLQFGGFCNQTLELQLWTVFSMLLICSF